MDCSWHPVAISVATSSAGAVIASSPLKNTSLRNACTIACLGNLFGISSKKKTSLLLHARSSSVFLSVMKPVGIMHVLEEPVVSLPTSRASFSLQSMIQKHAQVETAFSIFVVSAELRLLRFSHSSERCCTTRAQETRKQQMDVGNLVEGDVVNLENNDWDETSGATQRTKQRVQGMEKGSVRVSPLAEEELLRTLALAENAECAIAILSQKCIGSGGTLLGDDCSKIIDAALAEGNFDLAFSILNAMRSSQLQRRLARSGEKTEGVQEVSWRWPQPDVKTYIALVRGLAAILRVSDAIRTVADVKRRGVPAGEEVPFGKVVKCPTCETALAVVQPHQGIQLVPCSKCRYQYELMSGDVVKCESESISMNIAAFERGLRALKLMKEPIPSAVHSFVVRSPDGNARTHRFATASADVPAQEGERITVAAAAPVDSSRGIGPFKRSARAPGWRPSEPMSITNHATNCVYPLLRAPPKSGSGAALDTSILIPAAFLLASSDAATALIDPTLPRTVAISAVAAAVLGTAANTWLLPRLSQLSQRTADAIAVRQELLAQYELLQARLQELTQGATEEVRMLARICQLQNKMEAVQEATYSARMERVCRVREGLDQRLASRLELIDNYAKVSSMIEIEVELDLDVLAAEAGTTVANIATQIERLAEVERLQKQWKIQAEANDELERLLQSSPGLPDIA